MKIYKCKYYVATLNKEMIKSRQKKCPHVFLMTQMKYSFVFEYNFVCT